MLTAEERAMTEAVLQQLVPSHAAFLERLAGAPSPASARARHSHAAFLTLRLVDLLGPEREPPPAVAFQYQLAATERACRDLAGDSTETAHLTGLLLATTDAYLARDMQLVVPALLAYAHFLEDELRLSEALDVLETAVRVGGEVLRPADRVAVSLRLARVLRKKSDFDAAERAYEAAQVLAAATGDRHAELLSRIGRAHSVIGRGNLLEAERALRGVLQDADALGDREATARAHQVIAVALVTAGQPADAIPHVWQAFEMYDDELSQGRALADLGGMLLIVGDLEGAEHALRQAVQRGGEQDFATNAMVELMHCASARRDRVGFERWRERGDARRDRMPPNILADFTMKVGIGLARFGQFDRAERLLGEALTVAERGGLHEFTFRIERIMDGLRDCHRGCEAPPEATAEPEFPGESVREVSAALAHLGT
jgi:tetratricopeptide (TPR) repeat protein